MNFRIAPTVDLVLLSHGDLSHSGLYPYAYSRWGLKAPAYSTLPVQATGKIAAMEDVEGIRDEQDIGDEPLQEVEPQDLQSGENAGTHKEPSLQPKLKTGKYLATLVEVQDAFEYLNTLRYSQPMHLQGTTPTYPTQPPFPFIIFCRKMPGYHYHTFQCWAYIRRDNLENSVTNVWDYYICRAHESYEGAAFGWDCFDEKRQWWNLRAFGTTRFTHHGC
jgi:hypothetical protein